ncbi:hypothetical protein CC86DRAFT_420581 [Ophiobolus disseminans]|uniref:Protein kinase domain-containing protein n=1 Tax=Ophiobolus disseminans TaxID=1469910 RepID=A0A6A6ZTM6_9PLEO|nr:hypothetical protein CC86DRAFT_420581 [Ophiobolus disseminans]
MSPSDSLMAPPTLPHLFRTIRRLASASDQCGIFLCLPRRIDGEGDSAFVRAVEYKAVSALEAKHIALLPHLRIIKTWALPANVRNEVNVLEHLDNSLYIGSYLASAQITSDAKLSWLCEFPVFGSSLVEYAAKVKGISSWHLAHIFLGLLNAASYVHDEGYAHRSLTPQDVRINLYPRDEKYRYRRYPDIQLVNFGTACALDAWSAQRDVVALLKMMQMCIVDWSDSAPFLAAAWLDVEGAMVTDDPMMLVLRDVRQFLQGDVPTLGEVYEMFFDRLTDLRHGGAEYMSPALTRLLHADLVTGEEMEHALREPVMLQFNTRHEAFVRVIAGEPVVMGPGGHAGMRTNRVMVMRFTNRRADFARIGQEEEMEFDTLFNNEVTDAEPKHG